MNTQLEKLFDIYDFSQKDRVECRQIFTLLPTKKKIRFIEDFDSIAKVISQAQYSLHLEQEMLFGRSLQNIEQKIVLAEKMRLSGQTKSSISKLKSSLL